MPTTYYLSSTNDTSGGTGNDFSAALLTSASASATRSLSLAINSVLEVSYGVTPVGNPGASGVSASGYIVEVNVTTAGASSNLRVSLSRLNSANAVQATGSDTASQSIATTGIKTFNPDGSALGTWSTGDRLRVNYTFQNTSTMTAATPVITVNTADAEVVMPDAVAIEPRVFLPEPRIIYY